MDASMIEKVARSICRANVLSMMKLAGLAYHDLTVEAEVDRLFKDDMLGARAAIEALRVPTAEMKAAEGAHWDYSCHTCGGLAEGWHIMIDAALSHDEVKG